MGGKKRKEINKIDKSLSNPIKGKRQKTQIRTKNKEITNEVEEILKIERYDFAKQYKTNGKAK